MYVPETEVRLQPGVTRSGVAISSLLLVAALAVGCGSGSDPDPERVHRIEIEHVGSIIDGEGPGGSYGGQGNLTRLDDGRYVFWDHYQPTRLRVYDETLELDTVFGRAGMGPGEFQRPRFHGVIGDTLFVFQEWVGQLDLFDKDDFSHLDTRLARVGNPMALAFSPEGFIVASSMDMSPEGIGLPLREMDTSGRVRNAFGAEFPVVLARDVPIHTRQLDFAPDGSLWVVPAYEPRLERWTRSSTEDPAWTMDTAFVFETIEMDGPNEITGIVRTTDRPPSPSFAGVAYEEGGPVWIAHSVPHPDWRNRLWSQERAAELWYAPSTSQWRTRVMAVNPDSGEILASREVDELWLDFAGQGIAYSWNLDELGIPYIDLWRPHLVTGTEDP